MTRRAFGATGAPSSAAGCDDGGGDGGGDSVGGEGGGEGGGAGGGAGGGWGDEGSGCGMSSSAVSSEPANGGTDPPTFASTDILWRFR